MKKLSLFAGLFGFLFIAVDSYAGSERDISHSYRSESQKPERPISSPFSAKYPRTPFENWSSQELSSYLDLQLGIMEDSFNKRKQENNSQRASRKVTWNNTTVMDSQFQDFLKALFSLDSNKLEEVMTEFFQKDEFTYRDSSYKYFSKIFQAKTVKQMCGNFSPQLKGPQKLSLALQSYFLKKIRGQDGGGRKALDQRLKYVEIALDTLRNAEVDPQTIKGFVHQVFLELNQLLAKDPKFTVKSGLLVRITHDLARLMVFEKEPSKFVCRQLEKDFLKNPDLFSVPKWEKRPYRTNMAEELYHSAAYLEEVCPQESKRFFPKSLKLAWLEYDQNKEQNKAEKTFYESVTSCLSRFVRDSEALIQFGVPLWPTGHPLDFVIDATPLRVQCEDSSEKIDRLLIEVDSPLYHKVTDIFNDGKGGMSWYYDSL
jgi:hypothetical protein